MLCRYLQTLYPDGSHVQDKQADLSPKWAYTADMPQHAFSRCNLQIKQLLCIHTAAIFVLDLHKLLSTAKHELQQLSDACKHATQNAAELITSQNGKCRATWNGMCLLLLPIHVIETVVAPTPCCLAVSEEALWNLRAVETKFRLTHWQLLRQQGCVSTQPKVVTVCCCNCVNQSATEKSLCPIKLNNTQLDSLYHGTCHWRWCSAFTIV